MNRVLRKIWSVTWRLGLAALLMAWAFHAIFHDQCRIVLREQGLDLDALPRLERWQRVWSLGPAHLLSTLLQVQPGWLVVSILLWGLTILLGAWRWYLVLCSQGLRLSPRRTLEISFVAHFFNSFLLGSTGGDVLKAYYAARVTHHLKTEAVTTVLIDRVLGLFTMLAFAAVMLLPNLTLIVTYGRTLALAAVIVAMAGAAGVFLFASLRGGVSQLVPGARRWLQRLPKGEVLERGLGACRALGRNRRLLWQTLAISLLLTVVCVYQLLTLVWGYGQEVRLVPLLLIVPSVICISALPITPSSLGVRDNLYLYLLSLPEIGVKPSTAIAVSLVAWAASLVWSAVGGLLYLFMRRDAELAEVVAETRPVRPVAAHARAGQNRAVGFRDKLLRLDALSAWREQQRALGRRLVVTNGCFDLLHVGHATYLEAARAEGDLLLVGVNSDASVRRLKGPSRPVNAEEDRAALIAALGCVDAVCVFDETSAQRFLEISRPDVWAKGADYTLETLNQDERRTVESAGGRIAFLELVPGRSTTSTLRKLGSDR